MCLRPPLSQLFSPSCLGMGPRKQLIYTATSMANFHLFTTHFAGNDLTTASSFLNFETQRRCFEPHFFDVQHMRGSTRGHVGQEIKENHQGPIQLNAGHRHNVMRRQESRRACELAHEGENLRMKARKMSRYVSETRRIPRVCGAAWFANRPHHKLWSLHIVNRLETHTWQVITGASRQTHD